MKQQPDYRRRRITLAAATALLLVATANRAPVIGTISITMNDHMVPRVAADWTPPVDLAMAGLGHLIALVQANRTH